MPSSALTPNLPHNFPPQALGTASAAQPEVLSNTGKVPLPISSIKIGGIDTSHFTQTNNCGAKLAAGASCTINVVSKPTTAGSKSATLIVNDAAGIKSVALSGSGTGSFASKLSLASVNYPTQQIGTTSAVRAVKIANTGTAPLPVTSIVISGTDATDFAQANTCATPVPVGGSCAINVKFAPSTIGPKTATLTVVDGAGMRTVALSGTGATVSSTLAPNSSYDFGLLKVGKASAVQAVTLSNTGGLPLAIKGVKLGGANVSHFSQKNNCVGNLAVGTSCKINVVFKPNALGSQSAQLIVDDAAGPKTIALSGKGQ
ncbi:hypothetical protein FGKAn22_14030 [Ferrigenium kumadai]|uniref:HYDIN/VesB/CFA65-like Ig-like domain-containing protein n=1 Tax=Ferrigenium kumadai TaxID=1682490 RepID=A0AAN1VZT2_9PROT|nr:choice-of-anchor D domain-containing protein [Ferrigenium kumadai]BBI99710.1 hypothetical protein FGKAn22_14030 [Ferrigenium kumadai]